MAEDVKNQTNEDMPDWSAYRGVLVFVEHREGVAKSVSWQLIGQGKRLAEKLDTQVMAIVIGDNVETLANEAISYGADRVFLIDSPELHDYRTFPYSRATMKVIHEFKPEICLFGATATGRDLAGAIATHLPTGLTADCTQLDVEPHPSRLLLASRPAFSEKMMATILCKQYRPQMATARGGVFEALPRDPNRKGEIVKIDFHVEEEAIAAKVLDFIRRENEINIEEAEIIVAGGRGLGNAEGFKLLQQLADELGGVVGASRPCVDAGWIKHAHQVGQTGYTVRPKLYFAFGISGAVQHAVGMQNSDMIIAVNRDPDAPIFKIANYGIVGDLFEIVPAIIEEARRRKGTPAVNKVNEEGGVRV